MRHPRTRAERRALRENWIARRKFIATKIWTRFNEVPHEGSPWYQLQPGWYQPTVWGRYAKINLNCGCKLCHCEKYFSYKRQRRRALDQAVIDNLLSWEGAMVCENCGKDKPDVCERPDPYAADIDGEVVLVVICDDCAVIRADET
jgi:hypothetical protein